MILGTNIVHAAHYWSSMRPWHEEALQIETPWMGDWQSPVHAHTLVPNVLYRCRVSSNGEAVGPKRFRLSCQHLRSFEFRGSITVLETRATEPYERDAFIRIGMDNAWLEITVSEETKLSDIRMSMIEQGSFDEHVKPPAAAPWSDNFLALAKPFSAWRMMDFCGIGSRVQTMSPADSYGPFAQRPLREGDVDPEFGTFNAMTGVNPALWFVPGAKDVWVNCPLLIALDPGERARWLVEVWFQSEAAARRYHQPPPRLMIEVDNELENNDFTMARFAYRHARYAHWNQAAARTVGILRVARAMKQTIADLGFQSRMSTVFATLPGNRWPFSYDRWLKSYVSEEARVLLKEVGNFATTFYWGAEAVRPDQVMRSVIQEGENLQAWRDLMDELEVPLHVYEAGPHFRREALPALHRAPETIDAAKVSIEVLNKRLVTDARVFWYGFCERRQWGLVPQLMPGQADDPLYKVVAEAAAVHAY